VRVIVYAVIHSLRWTLDDSLELIGRLAEIDRRIAMIERLASNSRPLPVFSATRSKPQRRSTGTTFQPAYPGFWG
jgi:hypothetical protein